jgi:two-component system, sensor histidine kinase and response regulator
VSVLALCGEPAAGRLLQACLENIPGWDVELRLLGDPEAGLAERTRPPVDLVILDDSLGIERGLATLRTLREAGDDCPVLVLTGSDHEDTALRLMMAGATDCMPKGAVSSKSLRRAIANATEQHRLSRAIETYRRESLRREQETHAAAATLSHELKTPLTSAREFISIVLDGLGGPLTPKQREYLSLAAESCDQLAALVTDLLDVARLETGKLPLDPVPASMGDLASRLVALLTPAAHEKGIRLRLETAPGLPPVRMDENRIAQVVTNLLSNALKFTPTGGEVVLRVAERPERPGSVLVSVTDTGRGIEQEQLDRVFDRLYQARRSDAALHGGLGLGLSICRELVALHGGDIWVESQPGRGSTFAFTLPACEPPPAPRTSHPVGGASLPRDAERGMPQENHVE